MSPALLDPVGAPASNQNHSLNGQFFRGISSNSSGFSSKNPFEQSGGSLYNMNPSSFGDKTSGFSNSNEDNPSFRFNSQSVPRSGSGLSRPRLCKVRKQVNSQDLRSTSFPETRVGPTSFNPFIPITENSFWAPPPLSQTGSGDLRFGDRNNYRKNLGFSGNVDSSMDEFVDSNLLNDLKKVEIKDGNDRDNVGSHFVESELPKDLKKLNIKDNVDDTGSSANSLEEKVKNMKISDCPLNPDRVERNETKIKTDEKDGCFSGREEDLLSRDMEKVKLGNEGEEGKKMETEIFCDKSYQDLDHNDKISPSSGPERADGFKFSSKKDSSGMPFVEFKTQRPKANLFCGLNQKVEFNARRNLIKDTRVKKKSGKLKQPTSVQLCLGQDLISSETSSQENCESSESYSPMEVSPYRETLAENQHSREDSVISDDSSNSENNQETPESTPPGVPSSAIDEDRVIATGRLDINEGNAKGMEKKLEGDVESECCLNTSLEDSISGAETESFKSAEELDFSNDIAVTSAETEASSSSSTFGVQFGFSLNSEERSESNFTFSASSGLAQAHLLASKRNCKKKGLFKGGQDNAYTSAPLNANKIPHASSPVQFALSGNTSSLLSPGRRKKGGDLSSTFQRKYGDESQVNKGHEMKQESVSITPEIVAAQEGCEKWRLRGNQAYANGELSSAEHCYTKGVECVSRNETSRSCLRALMLCYSNRAATRMSLGRLRDVISDCMMAASIDPTFLKVQLRAANCYLALGEIEDALRYFKKCLQLGSDGCVDQKVTIEASDGVQNAQKVSQCMNHSAELLRSKTSNDIENALNLISEALMISSCSESLLEMKAQALYLLWRYEEVIQICEKTIGSAEKNSPSIDIVDQINILDAAETPKKCNFRIWRCHLILKSYFHLGRLEKGLAFLEKEEEKVSLAIRNGIKMMESSIPLAATVRELLHQKAAGNEAFQNGRHLEAVEHYSAALSWNVESRPFTAVCFCNRAAAYKALGQVIDAIADCNLAMALDREYLKAISRRATLYEMIRDYEQAARDLQRLITLLTKQLEKSTNQSAPSDRSLSSTNDLRQAHLRLLEIEEESRKEIPLDMYVILGVALSVPAAEIKKAYRKAALRHHPDKAGQYLARNENGDEGIWKQIGAEVHRETEKLFKIIGESYAVLSDPIKRSRYDAEEEMRNVLKKRTGSSMSRTTQFESNQFERSGTRQQWREGWKSYGNPASRGSEATRSTWYS